MAKEKETKQKSSEKVHRRSQTGGYGCSLEYKGTGPRGERPTSPLGIKKKK